MSCDLSSLGFLGVISMSRVVPYEADLGRNDAVLVIATIFVSLLQQLIYLANSVVIVACRIHNLGRLVIKFVFWWHYRTFQDYEI